VRNQEKCYYYIDKWVFLNIYTVHVSKTTNLDFKMASTTVFGEKHVWWSQTKSFFIERWFFELYILLLSKFANLDYIMVATICIIIVWINLFDLETYSVPWNLLLLGWNVKFIILYSHHLGYQDGRQTFYMNLILLFELSKNLCDLWYAFWTIKCYFFIKLWVVFSRNFYILQL